MVCPAKTMIPIPETMVTAAKKKVSGRADHVRGPVDVIRPFHSEVFLRDPFILEIATQHRITISTRANSNARDHDSYLRCRFRSANPDLPLGGQEHQPEILKAKLYQGNISDVCQLMN
jgi:hypothetical protein